jgi:hypothetical protein
MTKKLQVSVSQEAWNAVEALCSEANLGFDAGNVSVSDAVNEMILSARVDVKALQTKRTDLRRALRAMAGKEELDLESVIRSLSELRGKTGKKRSPTAMDEEF